MKSTWDNCKKWGGLAQWKNQNKTEPPSWTKHPYGTLSAVSQEYFQHHTRFQVTGSLISNTQQNLQNGCRYRAELCNSSSKSQQKSEGRNPKKDKSCLNTSRQRGVVWDTLYQSWVKSLPKGINIPAALGGKTVPLFYFIDTLNKEEVT